ncbi:MAG: hypothetical protein V3S33_00740 [Gammaproteobacteria bacterium]
MSMTQLFWNYRRFGFAFLLLLFLSACTSMGSRTIPRDQFNYNEALVQSRNQQMLLNIVRLRYLDIPNFLAVSSVITSYSYDGNVGVAGTRADGNSDLVPDTIRGQANLGYSERPTITYTPLAGQDFARRLLKPIPVEAVFALGHAGWPVDILMTTTLQRINDVENMGFGQVPAPGDVDIAHQFQREEQKLQRFQHVLKLITVLLDREALEVQRRGDEKLGLPYLHFAKDLPLELQSLVDELKRELKLEPRRNTFRITDRTTERGPDEITIQSRSLMSMMSFLSRGIDIPEEDRNAGVVVVIPPAVLESILARVPLRIRSQKEAPKDPYVAVKYRNNWFYIDHSDIKSKRTFATIQVFFQLAAPSGGAAAPLLTLPAGG